ncbi:NAD(P)-dependent oxidoreductase [Peribacillus frigoritolerans]|uniref:NAD(P)-dependent oxidoreductase n=1 Tax=Peribacillus frigoritolerans TaxID=450367 RepID=UPI00227FF33C|nr:NAD(P)-dependent oxidoreductase [Peribacillus frigoritolerans]MCY9002459.1 NAD(P)-dependent oxidoreductase [Peribacillus frigoritolerans]
MESIGFIGIGKMGRWMAEHLLNAGYCLTVYDTNQDATNDLQEKGALIAPSIFDLGKENKVVITMLPNSKIVESVVTGEDGLLSSMNPGGLIIDMSSSYVFLTKTLAEKLANTGLTLIDAPVSGGVKGAKAGTLTIMVGAKREYYEKALPILRCMGENIMLVGETGSGHALKAINNYLSAASLYATTEAMILAKKLGIDLSVALEAINHSSGRSFSTQFKFPTFIVPRSFNSGFSLDLLLKDVKMVTSIAKDSKVPIFLASTVEQVYEAASITGEEDQDHTEIIKFLEKITNKSLIESKELECEQQV